MKYPNDENPISDQFGMEIEHALARGTFLDIFGYQSSKSRAMAIQYVDLQNKKFIAVCLS